jgi:hypothetical protein
MKRPRVHPKQREHTLAAAIGQQNAKSKGGNYSTGKTQKIHYIHDGVPNPSLSIQLLHSG